MVSLEKGRERQQGEVWLPSQQPLLLGGKSDSFFVVVSLLCYLQTWLHVVLIVLFLFMALKWLPKRQNQIDASLSATSGKRCLVFRTQKTSFLFHQPNQKELPISEAVTSQSRDALVGLDSAAQVQTAGGNKGLNEGALQKKQTCLPCLYFTTKFVISFLTQKQCRSL